MKTANAKLNDRNITIRHVTFNDAGFEFVHLTKHLGLGASAPTLEVTLSFEQIELLAELVAEYRAEGPAIAFAATVAKKGKK